MVWTYALLRASGVTEGWWRVKVPASWHGLLRLEGTDTVPTELGSIQTPDAVLCRTNVGGMHEVMQLLETDHRVELVGGGEALRALARAADDLKEGRRSMRTDGPARFGPRESSARGEFRMVRTGP